MEGQQNDTDRNETTLSLQAQVESLLFVATEPIPLARLADVLGVEIDQVEQVLLILNHEYAGRGMRLQRKGKRVQMVTAPEASDLVRRLLGLELTGKLSPAALETLAIVAYRQPVTRAQIEAVRGVSSDSVLRTLINRGLVEELGRLDQAGRPIIFGTTFDFLQQFGITSLDQLPPLKEIPAP
jgi:segregation and condensation protein B